MQVFVTQSADRNLLTQTQKNNLTLIYKQNAVRAINSTKENLRRRVTGKVRKETHYKRVLRQAKEIQHREYKDQVTNLNDKVTTISQIGSGVSKHGRKEKHEPNRENLNKD